MDFFPPAAVFEASVIRSTCWPSAPGSAQLRLYFALGAIHFMRRPLLELSGSMSLSKKEDESRTSWREVPAQREPGGGKGDDEELGRARAVSEYGDGGGKDEIMERIEGFKQVREEKKRSRFYLVFMVGLANLVFWFFLYTIFNLFVDVFPAGSGTPILFGFLACSCLAIAMMAFVVVSTVDPQMINFDTIIEKNNWASIVLRVGTCAIMMLTALSWYGTMAIPAGVYAIYNIVFLLPESYIPNFAFTKKFIICLFIDQLVSIISLAYETYENATGGSYSLRTVFNIDVNAHPSGSAYTIPNACLSAYCFAEFVFTLWFWRHYGGLYKKDQSKGYSPTATLYLCYYLLLNRFGLISVVKGAVGMHYMLQEPNAPPSEYTNPVSFTYIVVIVVSGLLMLAPPVIVLTIGPKRIFDFTARRFDRDLTNLINDGKFVAELLDSADITLNQIFWVHADEKSKHLQPRTEFDEMDCRRNWYQGWVSAVDAKRFRVTVNLSSSSSSSSSSSFSPSKVHEELPDIHIYIDRKNPQVKPAEESGPSSDDAKTKVKASSKPGDSDDMLALAFQNLRCIDWKNIKEDLFVKSVRDESAVDVFSLSRPLVKGERISYFVSHAWADKGELKYAKLKQVAEQYHLRHLKWPTFWLDKCCFDQSNLSDGLKCLPINVMVCDKVLVLCGDHYDTRLWCIWELFTLFSFAKTAQAIERLEIVPLSEDINLKERLAVFNVDQARCYDPNEQAKIMSVIQASGGGDASAGAAEFNLKIHVLAQSIKQSKSAKASGKP